MRNGLLSKGLEGQFSARNPSNQQPFFRIEPLGRAPSSFPSVCLWTEVRRAVRAHSPAHSRESHQCPSAWQWHHPGNPQGWESSGVCIVSHLDSWELSPWDGWVRNSVCRTPPHPCSLLHPLLCTLWGSGWACRASGTLRKKWRMWRRERKKRAVKVQEFFQAETLRD